MCRIGISGEGMQQNRIRCRKGSYALVARVALGAALAVVVVCTNSVARAGDDDSDQPSFMSKFMHTIGLGSSEDGGISYSERSPLVVPPTRDLPPPAAGGPPPAPNWPKDPDMKKRSEAKAEKKDTRYHNWVVDESRPLRPDELNVPGARPSQVAHSDQAEAEPDQTPKRSIFNFDWLKREQYGTFTGEPARAALTDPPPGYQTPSPDQPYGIAPEKKVYKPQTLGERMEIQR